MSDDYITAVLCLCGHRLANHRPPTASGLPAGRCLRKDCDCTTYHWRAIPLEAASLPLHRTEAGYPRCATCDGGGCPDCTDGAA